MEGPARRAANIGEQLRRALAVVLDELAPVIVRPIFLSDSTVRAAQRIALAAAAAALASRRPGGSRSAFPNDRGAVPGAWVAKKLIV